MIIEDIVSQHAEEAAFLWLLRDNAMRAPHYDLKDFADLEERVEAHLDGLRVAGDAAWPFCAEGLQHQEAGEVYAAGFIALDASKREWLNAVLDVVSESPETTRGMVSALGWVGKEKLQGQVVDWLKDKDPHHRLLGIGACAVQRVDCGAYLSQSVQDEHPAVRARALRSVGELRRRDLLPAVLEHLYDEFDDCRFWAAWSATLMGNSEALTVLQQFAEEAQPYRESAMMLALRAMDRSDSVSWIRDLNKDPDFARLVVQSTGIIGDSVSVPWLIEKMAVPELARVAGEAFSLMTGIDLAYDDLETDWPEGFEAGPTENPQDENVAMDADEDLPWPAPDLLAAWWSKHRSNYPNGQRLLCGKPISGETCIDVLKNGFQRQRRAAALELALLNPSEPLFNTSAPARRQMRRLGPG